MKLLQWTALPTRWIVDGGLTRFRWINGRGADETAALMTLLHIAHMADQENGIAKVTYDQLQLATGRSREKISCGLGILIERNLVEAWIDGQSTYRLLGYDRSQGWGKLPAKKLYAGDCIHALNDFRLRRIAELDALKLYYLVVAFRDNGTNLSMISYDKIVEKTGIDRSRVKAAISLLVTVGLVHVERQLSTTNEYGVSNAYRLTHLEPFRHMGTMGRSELHRESGTGDWLD